MHKIRKLPEQIINLIAAGEVVERPASIVKELLENSIDAGADKIIIKVDQGGIERISIEDNGTGMPPADALLAFTQHATSKIYSEEDLLNISTLGFRGEALASISSVADIEMETLAAGAEPTRIKASQSTIEHLDGSKTTIGTTIVVESLFSGIPARKKFMKSESTEFRHIQELVFSTSLTKLDTHFELWHNGRLSTQLPKAAKMQDRIFDLWGKEIADNLYEIETELNDTHIKAYIGSPDIARRDRSKQYLFINSRVVSDKVVQRAISEAYKGFMHRDLNPVYFLFLDLPGDAVDVNVHPRKLEVRFKDSGNIYRFVYNTLRTKLEAQTKSDLHERVSTSRSEDFNFDRLNRMQPSKPSFSNSGTSPSSASRSVTIPSFTKQLKQPTNTQKFERPEEVENQKEAEDNFANIEPIQLFNTYILYEKDDQLIFIDQHAAAESIQYERILDQADVSSSKPKLVPDIIDLEEEQKTKLLESTGYLAKFGLTIDDFGGSSIQITGTPEGLNNFDSTAFIQEFLQNSMDFENIDISDIEQDVKRNLEIHNPKLHTLIATMACHGSIRAGQRLSIPEMQQIIRDLNNSRNTYNCPHGRPVSWVMDRTDLEKNFNRIVS